MLAWKLAQIFFFLIHHQVMKYPPLPPKTDWQNSCSFFMTDWQSSYNFFFWSRLRKNMITFLINNIINNISDFNCLWLMKLLLLLPLAICEQFMKISIFSTYIWLSKFLIIFCVRLAKFDFFKTVKKILFPHI